MSLHGRPFLRRGPSGPLASNAAREIVQIGYDQGIDTMTVPPSAAAFFPRDLAGNPLKVVLPDVTPGNVLEIDWRLNLQSSAEGNYPSEFDVRAIAVVTFDGAAPVFPSATTFFVSDSWGTSSFSDYGEGSPGRESLGAVSLIVIPAGATIATIQLLYIAEDGEFLVGGAVDFEQNGLSSALKVWELASILVSQAGPGNLIPTT